MSTAANYAKLEFPSLSENVAFARSAAAVFASRLDFTLDEIDEIKVAASEAVSNAVVHAYRGGAPGPVRMTLEVRDGALVITVEDDGCGIEDVEWAKEAAHTTDPEERMGLGLVFISEYMNEVDLTSTVGRGTRLRMVKRPARAGGAALGGPRGRGVLRR